MCPVGLTMSSNNDTISLYIYIYLKKEQSQLCHVEIFLDVGSDYF